MVTTIKSISDFEKKLGAASDKLVVIDFYSTNCSPCKEMDPHMRKLAKLYKDRAIIVKVNVNKFQDISDYYRVKSTPTFVFIKNQRRVSSFAGADPKLLIQKMASFSK